MITISKQSVKRELLLLLLTHWSGPIESDLTSGDAGAEKLHKNLSLFCSLDTALFASQNVLVRPEAEYKIGNKTLKKSMEESCD